MSAILLNSGYIETQNAEHGTRNAERGTQNAERGTRNAKRGTQNAERGTQNAEHGTFQTSNGLASLGILQSPLGERLIDPTFGPSGMHERLNCCAENR